MVGLGLSGFCSLGYEVLWTRLLILMVDNSVYSFTIILVAFLLGIAIGSLLLAPVMKNLKNPLVIFVMVEMGIGFTAFFFPFFIHIQPVPGWVPYSVFLVQGVFLMVLAPSILMGMTLPLAAQVYQGMEGRVGVNLGNLYAINTVGGVLGALAGGFVLVPFLGFLKSSLLLPAMNWVIGGAIGLSILKGNVRRAGLALSLTGILVLGILLMPHDLFREKYAQLVPEGRLTFYKEGLAATATIFEQKNGERILYLNGIPQVQNDKTSLKTFKILGALPCLLHKNPAQGLTITFGAGITSGTMAHLVERLDCVELVDEAREIADRFSVENGHILKNSRVSLHINDARHYLLTTGKRYAVIVADATHPRGYDSWVLFTREFYELVKKRLEPDGLFCQWVPLHGMNLDQYMAIVGTFFAVFPHTSIWAVDSTYSLLLGSVLPEQMDFRRLEERFAGEKVRQDLSRVGLQNPFRFLSHFSMGENGVRKMLEPFPAIITDDSPRHLFFPLTATFGEQYGKWPEMNYAHLSSYGESIIPYLTNLGSTENQKSATIARIKMYQRHSF